MAKRAQTPLSRRILTAIRAIWRPQSISELDSDLERGYTGQISRAGNYVTRETALRLSAWFNGVQQICQTIASLPINVYIRTSETNREKRTNSEAHRRLHFAPNSAMSAFTWKETGQHHLLHRGNFYSYIERDPYNRIRSLWPLNPDRVTVLKLLGGNLLKSDKAYIYRNDHDQDIPIDDYEMLHIPGLGYDGLKGYAVLDVARESLGIAQAQDEFAARFFSNGTNVGSVVTFPGKMSDDAYTRMKTSVSEAWGGLGNAHKAIVLEEGGKFEKVTMPLKDAQFLESRIFSIQEVARWLNIPPHKLKELSRATYDNITAEQMSYFMDTIRPWLERWEAAINTKLFAGLPNVYAEFNFDALLRADIKTRYDAYAVGKQHGWLNTNEIRSKENMRPVDGEQGEVYWMPENYRDARDFARLEEQEPPPTEESTDDEELV